MSEELEFGLTIMAVGMITVFSILGFVVFGGKVMILIINKLEPNIIAPPSSEKLVSQPIGNTKISVLTSAVSAITKGKGKITSIKKL